MEDMLEAAVVNEADKEDCNIGGRMTAAEGNGSSF